MQYNDTKDLSSFTKVNTNQWDTLKDNLRLRVINSKRIEKYGDDIATKRLNDISVCLSVQEKIKDTVKSYLLTHKDIESYGISVHDAFKQGIQNTSHDRGIRIMTLKQYMMRDTQMFALASPNPSPIMVGENPMMPTGIIYDTDEDSGKDNILCICNKHHPFGASYLACPEVLENIYERFGENYYIIPLSVHELMCVRYNYATQNNTKPVEWTEDDLLSMIERINDNNNNNIRDILSYRLYYYLGDDGKKLFPIY